MQISDIYKQSVAADWAKKASSDSAQAKKENASKNASKSSNTQKSMDSVTVSGNAGKSKEASAAMLASRATALPEIREEKINTAQERIESGFYNTNEFNKELASRLVDG